MRPILIITWAVFVFSASGGAGLHAAPPDSIHSQGGGKAAAGLPLIEIAPDSAEADYRLEEIVVYGKRYRKASMTTELEGEEVSRTGAPDVAHLLRLDSGLAVTSGPKAETETRIRGFPARGVLVLLDGRPLNTGYYGKVDLSMIPAESIARIKVVKGPASVAYGANSMGGVINIITKNGTESSSASNKAESTSASLTIGIGENGYRRTGAGYGGRWGSVNYWILGYEHYREGFDLSDEFQPTSIEDGARRDNSGYHKAGATVKLGYRASKSAFYSLSAGYHWSERDIPATVYSWDGPSYRSFPRWSKFGGALSARFNPSEEMEITSVLYADAQHDRLIDYQDREMSCDRINYDSKLENWTLGGSVSLEGELGDRHLIRAGAAFKRDLMNKKPDLDEVWYSRRIHTGNIFAEDRLDLWDSGDITLGAGYSLYSSENEEASRGRFCPMASIGQELPLGLKGRAAFSREVRFPTLHHLYSQSSGNEDLKPEEAVKLEFGLERWLVSGEDLFASLEVAYFHNELRNLIYRASRSYRYVNIGEAVIAGLEARMEWSLFEYLSGRVSYAFIDREASTGELMEELPSDKFQLLVSAAAPFGLELVYQFGAFGRRTTYVPGFYLESYNVHNLRAVQKITSNLDLRAGLSNILDEDFQEELGFPAAGRQFRAGLTYSM